MPNLTGFFDDLIAASTANKQPFESLAGGLPAETPGESPWRGVGGVPRSRTGLFDDLLPPAGEAMGDPAFTPRVFDVEAPPRGSSERDDPNPRLQLRTGVFDDLFDLPVRGGGAVEPPPTPEATPSEAEPLPREGNPLVGRWITDVERNPATGRPYQAGEGPEVRSSDGSEYVIEGPDAAERPERSPDLAPMPQPHPTPLAGTGDSSPDGQGVLWEALSSGTRNSLNSVGRGASSEGPLMGAQGLYSAASAMLDNPYFRKADNQLRDDLSATRQELETVRSPEHISRRVQELQDWLYEAEELASRGEERAGTLPSLLEQKEQHKLNLYLRAQAGNGPGPDEGPLLSRIRQIEAVQKARAAGEQTDTRQDLSDFFYGASREAAEMRENVRRALPVEPEFAESFAGQVLQGVGQLAMIPAYRVPVLGEMVTMGQLYQEAWDDYARAMERQGRPFDEEEANRVGMKYLAGAAPIEVLTDRLILKKALTAAKGKVTVGQLAKTFAVLAPTGGATEGTQQYLLDEIAKRLEGYDPNRELSEGVIDSLLVGGLVSGLGGAGAQKVGSIRPATFEERVHREAERVERMPEAPVAPGENVPVRNGEDSSSLGAYLRDQDPRFASKEKPVSAEAGGGTEISQLKTCLDVGMRTFQ